MTEQIPADRLRILVVGGTSSLARALIPALQQFAHVVTAGRSGCDVKLDLSVEIDPGTLPMPVDVLINTAASFASANPADLARMVHINALGTLKLCQLCSAAGIARMVQVSSIFTSLEPGSPFYSAYSLSKRHADELAQLYCKQAGLALTIIKPAQFYGTGPAYRKHQPFLYSIIDKVANHEDVPIYGSHDASRNFIHVEDVARLIALAVRNQVSGSYACAPLQPVRYSDIIRAAAAAFDSRSRMVFVPGHPDIADNTFAADDTLYRLVGAYPAISIEQGMLKEAAYRKGNQ